MSLRSSDQLDIRLVCIDNQSVNMLTAWEQYSNFARSALIEETFLRGTDGQMTDSVAFDEIAEM